jgi:hypothetical protein
MKLELKRLIFAGVVLFIVGSANAAVLTFDDLSGSSPDPIADGYGGLNWSNMRSFFGCFSRPDSGYCSGTVSGYNVAFNMYGNAAATSSDSLFDFDGAYLTAAWNNDLNIEVLGFNGASLLYNTTVVVSDGAPTWFDFAYAGIDRLEFRSFGGVDSDPTDGYSGVHFAMDNFTYNIVPIPAAVWLFGSGLGLLGWMRCKQTV